MLVGCAKTSILEVLFKRDDVMKKLSVVMAALLVASGAVMAQDEESSASTSTGTIGGIATGTVVAGAVAAGVLAAVVSNNRSDSAPAEEPEPVPTCEGTDPLVGGVCVGTTVTVSGTTTVPVTFTYAPTLQ